MALKFYDADYFDMLDDDVDEYTGEEDEDLTATGEILGGLNPEYHDIPGANLGEKFFTPGVYKHIVKPGFDKFKESAYKKGTTKSEGIKGAAQRLLPWGKTGYSDLDSDDTESSSKPKQKQDSERPSPLLPEKSDEEINQEHMDLLTGKGVSGVGGTGKTGGHNKQVERILNLQKLYGNQFPSNQESSPDNKTGGIQVPQSGGRTITVYPGDEGGGEEEAGGSWWDSFWTPSDVNRFTGQKKSEYEYAHGGEIQSYNKQQSRKSTNIYNQARKFRR